MNSRRAFKYAAYSTFYIWMAIFVFLYFSLRVSFSHTLSNPMYFIPLISTFISGFFLFNRINEPWFLGIIHYIVAHVLVCYLFFIWDFIDQSLEQGISKRIFINSFLEGVKAVFFSMMGIQFVLPCFIIGGYLSKKRI